MEHIVNLIYIYIISLPLTTFCMMSQGSILENIPLPPQGGEISADVIWGENMKRRREKRGKSKKKRKRKEKGRGKKRV
jgi:hypothetical protein